MLRRLRWKFILVAAASLAAVLLVFVLGLNAAYYSISTSALDQLLTSIAANEGEIPAYSESGETRPAMPWDYPITEETRDETRYFLIWADQDRSMVGLQLDFINAVSQIDAAGYFEQAMNSSAAFGYIDHYRFYRFAREDGYLLIFLDCSLQLRNIRNVALISAVGAAVVLLTTALLLFLFSKRAIQPTVQSVERQKRFITDASHEIKTPLTAILAISDVLRMDDPDNEWLHSLDQEAHRLRRLVSDLVSLARLDEENPYPERALFSLTQSAWDILDSLRPRAAAQGKTLKAEVEDQLCLYGDEAAIQRLISILLDNALQYSVPASTIRFRLFRQRRSIFLETCNTCYPLAREELEHLFDRFYRTDPSRSRHTGGSGIGLSMAKSIVEAHGGQIRVRCTRDGTQIQFTACFRSPGKQRKATATPADSGRS